LGATARKDEHSPVAAEVTETDPNLAKACISRAAVSYSKGQYEHAVLDYTMAVEIKPGDAAIYYNRGNAYKANGQYDQAISDYTRAIAINPIYVGQLPTRRRAGMTRLYPISQGLSRLLRGWLKLTATGETST